MKQEEDDEEIIIKLQRESTGWMGMGIEPADASISGMQNTDMYIGWVDDAGVVTLIDAWAIGIIYTYYIIKALEILYFVSK